MIQFPLASHMSDAEKRVNVVQRLCVKACVSFHIK